MPRRTNELDRESATRRKQAGPTRSIATMDSPSRSSERRGWPLADGHFADGHFASSRPPVTLALVGGQRLLRDTVASLLTAEDGISVLGTFGSAADFLSAGSACRPSLLLLDCDGADPDGSRSDVEALSSALPHSRIVMLCEEIDEQVVRCAIECQVGGVILKSYSIRDIRAAIGYMATGRTIMPADWQWAVAPPKKGPLGLSPRQREILALIARGWHNDEIADELGISPNTAKFHIRAIYSRLGVRNRVEAVHRHAQLIGDPTYPSPPQ
jgi:DNA-binding NarL/FixJ family response regulator